MKGALPVAALGVAGLVLIDMVTDKEKLHVEQNRPAPESELTRSVAVWTSTATITMYRALFDWTEFS